jgi:hypothetical protein
MKLGEEVVEHTECLKSWIRSGITAGIRKLAEIEQLEVDMEAQGDGEVNRATATSCQDLCESVLP